MPTEKERGPITRPEMLAQMHLTDQQHKHLIKEFQDFLGRLQAPEEIAVVKATMPHLDQAAKTFSGNVTPDDLKNAAGHDAEIAGFWGFAFTKHHR